MSLTAEQIQALSDEALEDLFDLLVKERLNRHRALRKVRQDALNEKDRDEQEKKVLKWLTESTAKERWLRIDEVPGVFKLKEVEYSRASKNAHLFVTLHLDLDGEAVVYCTSQSDLSDLPNYIPVLAIRQMTPKAAKTLQEEGTNP